MQHQISIDFNQFKSISDLDLSLKTLALKARQATENAYAPYSGFKVGAAIQFSDGTTATGSNQENAAYPSGLCAERTALFAAQHNFPNLEIVAIAIAATRDGITWLAGNPCGGCRQVLAEVQMRQAKPMKVLIPIAEDGYILLNSTDSLLPFGFVLS